MNDRELLEFIAAQVSGLTNTVNGLTGDVGELKVGQQSLERKVQSLEENILSLEKGQQRIEITLEHEIKPKIDALFDGYQQAVEQQNRIEQDVKRHEDILERCLK